MRQLQYANLSNGIHCHHLDDGDTVGITRIQSTWCEQKHWERLLFSGVGPDFYAYLAKGVDIIVHDVSERPRQPRAIWQGLEWIRYACERAWGIPVTGIHGRGGKAMEQYFAGVYAGLSKSALAHLKYYRKFRNGEALSLRGCGSVVALDVAA